MIRPAVAADATVLSALSIEVWLSTYIKLGITAAFADYVLAEFDVTKLRAALADPSEHVWVSQNLDGVDGYIRVTDGRDAPVEGCGLFEISTLYVQGRHQGRGVGGALLGQATSVFGGDLWLKVNAENRRAHGFYCAHGFERVGTTDFVIAGAAYANDVMAFVQPDAPTP